MLAPRFIVSPAAVTEPSVVPPFEHTFPLPILELQARRLAGLPGTQPWPFGCVQPSSALLLQDGPELKFVLLTSKDNLESRVPNDRLVYGAQPRVLGMFPPVCGFS